MTDRTINFALVQEVKKHEVLYNYRLPGYSKKDVTEKAWHEVADKMNLPVNECKEKWRNTRTVLMRSMKSPPSGSGANKKYYLAEAMQFCVPFVKSMTPPSCGNLPEVLTDIPENAENAENTENAENAMIDNSITVEDSSQALPTQLPFNPPAPSERTIQSSTHPNLMTQAKRSQMEADQSVAAYYKAKKTRLERTDVNDADTSQNINKNRAIKMFLLSLIPEIEELNDFQIRLLKRRILSCIDEVSAVLQPQSQGSPFVE